MANREIKSDTQAVTSNQTLTGLSVGVPDETTGSLANFCLGQDVVESRRALAWVNSICLVYLMIGVVGLKPQPIMIKKKLVSEEVVPTVVEPVVPAVQQVSADSPPDETPGDGGGGDAGGAIVAVTLDSAAVAFSVPTVGNVLVPMSMAQAPPVKPMAAVAPVTSATVERVGPTGSGGSRPGMLYPPEAQQRKLQGTVKLFFAVNESGIVTDVKIIESSGSVLLDRAAVEHIKRRWMLGPGPAGRQFETEFVFQLK